ncbi:MAG: long-chain fatty acid--CoA ligase [Cyclobacteriaceae bacterium]|nr:long-chain fatty acid--CoA ligase [Cyclobacteriaceae bacterium]
MEVVHHAASDFTRIFEVLGYQQKKYPNAKALSEWSENSWHAYSIETIIQWVDALACWFKRTGYQRGDRIMLMPLSGSPAWMVIDFACQRCGLVTVPVHPTSRAEDLALIAAETESKLCIAATETLVATVKAACGSAMEVTHLQKEVAGYFNWQVEAPRQEELEKLLAEDSLIAETDWVTILYTSGSSGMPKGVPLTHSNIIHNIKAILPMLPLEPHHRVLSFLPFSHILERMACYGYIAFGVEVYFNTVRENLAHDFLSVRPYFCTSVPRVLEKMYDHLQAQLLTKNFIKKKLITWAFKVAVNYKVAGKIRVAYALQLWTVRLLVLRHWRKRLGGNLRYMVVGAASLRPEIARMLSAAGVQVVEGYGMTETSPLISINRFEPGLNRLGTVGMVIPGIEVRIDEPDATGAGEILVRGPNVMSGYFKRPELNAEVFTPDGWLRTGDVGLFEKHRFLKITDRKKDIFKTSAGKYIAPQPLQRHFCQSPFIQQCLILGFQKPFVTALVVPNFEVLQEWCSQQHIHWSAPEYMVHNIKVRARLQQEIDALNQLLPNYEQVKNFVVCAAEWTAERGEVTASLKPVRQNIVAAYKSEIEKLYA